MSKSMRSRWLRFFIASKSVPGSTISPLAVPFFLFSHGKVRLRAQIASSGVALPPSAGQGQAVGPWFFLAFLRLCFFCAFRFLGFKILRPSLSLSSVRHSHLSEKARPGSARLALSSGATRTGLGFTELARAPAVGRCCCPCGQAPGQRRCGGRNESPPGRRRVYSVTAERISNAFGSLMTTPK